MASNRHLGRIVALQSLYEYDFREGEKVDIKAITERNLKQYSKAIGDVDFVHDSTKEVVKRQAEIDAILSPAAPEWPVEQIARIDRAVLRLAIYELVIKQEVPPKVIINEAVELAKSFGGENSSKFVNGVLGTVYREHFKETAEQPTEEE